MLLQIALFHSFLWLSNIPTHTHIHTHTHTPHLLFSYLFIWLHWVLVEAYRIFVVSHRIFWLLHMDSEVVTHGPSSCGVQALYLWLAGSGAQGLISFSAAVGISAPWPGIELRPSAVEAWNPNQWNTKEFLSSWFFFLKIALAIQGLFCFHANEKNFCSSSVKNVIASLIGVALNLWIALGSIVTLTI